MGNPAGVKRDFDALERRRFQALRLLRQGLNQSEVARRVRVVRQSVAHDAHPPGHFGLVQSLPQQPQGPEPSPFQSIEITSHSSRVSHTRLDARYSEKCRYIMRYSINENTAQNFVPEEGVEPTRPCDQRILSAMCMFINNCY